MVLDGHEAHAIEQAAQALRRGDLLGLPTETVYGLAADAGNDAAVRNIFQAKGRPSDHPLIVHVASEQGVPSFARDLPSFAHALMAAFWPGPLTLIVPRQADRAALAAGGQDSVGLRCPSHPVAQAVLKKAQALGVMGVAAPSANLFGRVSPTTAAHVASEFGDDLLILDGGACEVGIESTIVDCTRGQPILLRPGVITPAQLEAVCAMSVVVPVLPQTDAPRASGTLASHYAPRAKVRLMRPDEMATACIALTQQTPPHQASVPTVAMWTRAPLSMPDNRLEGVAAVRMPSDPTACAQALFAQLRDFDAMGVQAIWVEQPPDTPEWAGVLDRLRRAASPDR